MIVSYDKLKEEERELVLKAWSAADGAYVPYSYFPVGVALLAENVAGHMQIFFGGNIQNKSWDVDCCAERAVTFNAFEQGFRNLRILCMVTIQNPGGAPCGLCRQVLVELAPDAKLLCIQNNNHDVKVWTVRELLPEAKVREVVRFEDLDETSKELARSAIEKSSSKFSPYSHIAEGTAILARSPEGKEKVFDGLRIENGVYGGTLSAPRVAAHNAVNAGFDNFLAVAVYAEERRREGSRGRSDLPSDHFIDINGASLQTLRQFGLSTRVLNICISKQFVGCATVDQLLPDSFGPDAVV